MLLESISFSLNLALGLALLRAQATNKKLEDQISHDLLTGLPNRKLALDRLDVAIKYCNRYNMEKKLAVLFLDLDDFKSVNDTYGHRVGDLLLKEVANKLSSIIRDSDTLARISGDEFVIILPITNEDDVKIVTEKINQQFILPIEILGNLCYTKPSIGVAFNDKNTSAELLISTADKEMYKEKRKK